MSTKTVYIYDKATGAYHSIYEAQESPLEPGVFIEPVCSTEISPPVLGTNQVAVFASGAWSLQPDYRGQTIYDQTSSATQEVTAIGPVPSGFALTPPPPTLAQAQATQTAIINTARDAAAQANVQASISGTMYNWQADARSVAMLNGAITLAQNGGTLPLVWRSADNINVSITVLADLLAIAGAIAVNVNTVYAKSWALKLQIATATKVSKVQSIIW